jgi:hypothetical protein
MILRVGGFYMDNDEVLYECIALKESDKYSEAVMRVLGDAGNNYMYYSIFYRNHWAWCDRENCDFRLTEEVEYVPRIV